MACRFQLNGGLRHRIHEYHTPDATTRKQLCYQPRAVIAATALSPTLFLQEIAGAVKEDSVLRCTGGAVATT
jgi:hypothetical protein